MHISKTNGILLVLAILVLAAAGYMLFGTNETPAVSTTGAPTSAAEVQFLSLTQKIDPVEFDTSILSDLRFMRLVDIRTAIIPEQTGRPDPFAPLR